MACASQSSFVLTQALGTQSHSWRLLPVTLYCPREVRNSIYRYRKIHIDCRTKSSYRIISTISIIYGNTIRKISQGILIYIYDKAPSLLYQPLELPSNNRPSDLRAMKKLLDSHAIEEVTDPSSQGFCSRLFLVPKPDGWGASQQDRHLSGQWSPQGSNHHINWLEQEAIRLDVLQWEPLWINQTARVYCDNSTAVAHIRKQGGTHSISLFNKTLRLFHLLDQIGILLIPTHLPGARNVTADALSRLNSPSPTE